MPVLSRVSIARTSFGADEATARPSSLSHQRNAGMSSFEPRRSPVCAAPVCDDQSVSHLIRRCDPSWIQRAMFGAFPSRSARLSTSCPSPSISRNTTPGIVRLDGAVLPHLSLDDAAVEDRVVVDREHGCHDDRDHRQEGRQQDALPDAIDVEALVDDPRREPDEGAVQRERAEPNRPRSDRERKADEERPDERVEQAQDRRGQERHTPAAERDPRDDRGADIQPDRVDHQGDERTPDEVTPARRTGPPLDGRGLPLAHERRPGSSGLMRASLNECRVRFHPCRGHFTRVNAVGEPSVSGRAAMLLSDEEACRRVVRARAGDPRCRPAADLPVPRGRDLRHRLRRRGPGHGRRQQGLSDPGGRHLVGDRDARHRRLRRPRADDDHRTDRRQPRDRVRRHLHLLPDRDRDLRVRLRRAVGGAGRRRSRARKRPRRRCDGCSTRSRSA